MSSSGGSMVTAASTTAMSSACPSPAGGLWLSYQVPTQREGAIWELAALLYHRQGTCTSPPAMGARTRFRHLTKATLSSSCPRHWYVVGHRAPANWVQLNDNDWDLGSAGPVAVPGTSLLFVAGKPATNGSFGYLMKISPLGGIGKGAFTGALCLGGGAFGANATDVIGAGGHRGTYVYSPPVAAAPWPSRWTPRP